MIVVSDATPINHLIRAGLISILPEMFGEIIVPEAVHAELQTSKTPEQVKELIGSMPKWLHVKGASLIVDPDLDPLDSGEREAIILAEELHADFLLMDEKKGRRVALGRKLPVVGTVGLLERAALRGLIDFRTAFAALRNTEFYVSRVLEADYLSRFSASDDETA